MIISRLVLVAFCVVFAASLDARAQNSAPSETTGAAAETAKRIIDKNGLGLSPAQSRFIYELTRSEKAQPADTPAIGASVPDSMMIVELPVEAKDQIVLLRDFKFARLRDNVVVLVDPTSRVVVDVIRD